MIGLCCATDAFISAFWQVLRKLSAQNSQALVQHYGTLIPSLVGLLQQVQGPTKVAGDCTLGKVLQVSMPLQASHIYSVGKGNPYRTGWANSKWQSLHADGPWVGGSAPVPGKPVSQLHVQGLPHGGMPAATQSASSGRCQ